MLDIPHIGFIVAAYGVAFVVILAMIAGVVLVGDVASATDRATS